MSENETNESRASKQQRANRRTGGMTMMKRKEKKLMIQWMDERGMKGEIDR